MTDLEKAIEWLEICATEYGEACANQKDRTDNLERESALKKLRAAREAVNIQVANTVGMRV